MIDFRTHNETVHCAPLINSVLQSEIKLCSYFSIRKKVNNVKWHLAGSCWCSLSQLHINPWIKHSKKKRWKCNVPSKVKTYLYVSDYNILEEFPPVLDLTNRAFVFLKFWLWKLEAKINRQEQNTQKGKMSMFLTFFWMSGFLLCFHCFELSARCIQSCMI